MSNWYKLIHQRVGYDKNTVQAVWVRSMLLNQCCLMLSGLRRQLGAKSVLLGKKKKTIFYKKKPTGDSCLESQKMPQKTWELTIPVSIRSAI